MWTPVDGGCSPPRCRSRSPAPWPRREPALRPGRAAGRRRRRAARRRRPVAPRRAGAPGRARWRLLAVAPLLPVVGRLLALATAGRDPVSWRVLRWAPTVPGYLLADRRDPRPGRPAPAARRAAVAVEVALFLVACLVVVRLLVVGPDGQLVDVRPWPSSWSSARPSLATSAIMAAALTLLGVIEAGRRPMARASCSAGTVLLTARPRAWPPPPCCRDAAVPAGVARLPHRRRPPAAGPRRPARRRPPRVRRSRPTAPGGRSSARGRSCCRTSRCWPRSLTVGARRAHRRPAERRHRSPASCSASPSPPCTAG